MSEHLKDYDENSSYIQIADIVIIDIPICRSLSTANNPYANTK